MRIESELSKTEYLTAMKGNMEGHFDLGAERLTGFFFGPVFTVTYHSGFEWNRRVTNQKNTAVGIVRKGHSGCVVSGFRVRGLLAPPQFLIYYPICFALCCCLRMEWEEATWGFGIVALLALGFTMLTAVISALVECFTEHSEYGARELDRFLLNPAKFGIYSHTSDKS